MKTNGQQEPKVDMIKVKIYRNELGVAIDSNQYVNVHLFIWESYEEVLKKLPLREHQFEDTIQAMQGLGNLLLSNATRIALFQLFCDWQSLVNSLNCES